MAIDNIHGKEVKINPNDNLDVIARIGYRWMTKLAHTQPCFDFIPLCGSSKP